MNVQSIKSSQNFEGKVIVNTKEIPAAFSKGISAMKVVMAEKPYDVKISYNHLKSEAVYLFSKQDKKNISKEFTETIVQHEDKKFFGSFYDSMLDFDRKISPPLQKAWSYIAEFICKYILRV